MPIQEAKDLTKIPIKKLIDFLMTHGIVTKCHKKVEDKKKNNINSYALTIEKKEEEEASEEDKDLILIVRKLKKVYQVSND